MKPFHKSLCVYQHSDMYMMFLSLRGDVLQVVKLAVYVLSEQQ